MVQKKPIQFEVTANGCHVVTSHHLDELGYAKFKREGRSQLIHRWIYEQAYGKIPERLVVMHSCDNPSCINLNHLSLGTDMDNRQDSISKDRHFHVDIVPKRLKELRLQKGLSLRQLGELSGVYYTYISKIEKHQKNGSISTLNKLANALNVSLSELMEE